MNKYEIRKAGKVNLILYGINRLSVKEWIKTHKKEYVHCIIREVHPKNKVY